MIDFFGDINLLWLFILMAIAFMAGFIDAVAGGGGMLQLPALLFAGIPPVTALATNKIVGLTGTSFAVAKYALEKKIYWKLVLYAAIPCLIASYLGSLLAMKTSDVALTWMILLCIPVALFFVLQKHNDKEKNKAEDNAGKTILAISPIGFYDGLLGPGTGSYMTIAVHKLLKHDYLTATASIKPLNLLTNLGSAIAFMLAGKVLWSVAIPMAACNAAGGWLGGQSAIHRGGSYIRKVLIIMLLIMLLVNIAKLI